MNCINKYLVIIFLYGCSVSNIFLEEQKSSGNYINDIRYDVSILSEFERWENNEGIILFFNKGKVFRTLGMENDLQIFNYENFDFKKLQMNESYEKSYMIRFTNPETSLMNINYKYRVINNEFKNKSMENFDYVIEEHFEIPLIRWRGKNYYWIKNQSIVKSQQRLTPFTKFLEIESIKK